MKLKVITRAERLKFIKHINQNQGYQNDNYKYTDTYSNEHYHSAEEPRFEGIIRRKTIRYYIGNIGSKSNRTGLIQFLKEYGIEPVGVRIKESNMVFCSRWKFPTQGMTVLSGTEAQQPSKSGLFQGFAYFF